MNGAGSGIMKIVVTARRSSTCQQSFMHLGSRCRRIGIQRTVLAAERVWGQPGIHEIRFPKQNKSKKQKQKPFESVTKFRGYERKDKHRNLKYFHGNYIKNNISQLVVRFWGNLPILKTDDANCVRIPGEFTSRGIKTNSRKKAQMQ